MKALTIINQPHPSVTIPVPDMGLTGTEWGVAVYEASRSPHATRHTAPGAGEVATAISTDYRLSARVWPLRVGGMVVIDGTVVRLVRVDEGGVPTFGGPEADPAPRGPLMEVSATVPPPDQVAYAEDERDRLWTGRGAGTWRCLTDAAGATEPGGWEATWMRYGPLVPLVPVDVMEPQPREWAEPHRAGSGLHPRDLERPYL